MSRAILHIGTEKTGTTALQAYLATKRDALAERGFWYSKAAGKKNHLKLYLYASEGMGNAKTMIDRIAKDAESDSFENEFVEELEREVREHGDKTFVFSNEHCRGRLSKPQVARLHGLLSRLFDEIQIVVYIRRQDELAVSRYSTMLKAGLARETVINNTGEQEYFYDYWRFLQRWSAIFEKARMTVRIFEKGALKGDSVIADFCEATGVPALTHKDKRENQSLLPPYQEFLRQMNIRLLKDSRDDGAAVRVRLMRMILVKLGSGRGRMPSREQAEAFYQSYAESNEKVREKFFPERTTLFEEDFSRYPEDAQPPALDVETALDITAELWNIAMERGQFARDAQPSDEIEPAAGPNAERRENRMDGKGLGTRKQEKPRRSDRITA